jgi:nucleoside-diphosphate-sugar epimerase
MLCEKAIQQSRLQWSILRLAAVTPIHLQAQDPSIMFEFSPDARFEFLHPADAGTAFARAVAGAESIEKVLYIAGGEGCRMTYYDFTNALMTAIGIGPIPIDAFVRREPARFFGDWVDTEESQRLLQYQKRGLNEQLEDMKKDFGMLVPIIRLVRPLATWFVIRSSAYRKENRRIGVG